MLKLVENLWVQPRTSLGELTALPRLPSWWERLTARSSRTPSPPSGLDFRPFVLPPMKNPPHARASVPLTGHFNTQKAFQTECLENVAYVAHKPFRTRKCTLWRCKSTPTPKAKLLRMTSHYGSTVVRSVTEIPFHVFI